jgi:hypothetical protein
VKSQQGIGVMAIVDIDETQVVLDCKDDGSEPELTLILIDTDDQRHELVLEELALKKLVKLFRGIQSDLPGFLGGH